MQTVPTIKEFFEQMEQRIDPAHVAKLRAEWTTLTIGQAGEIAAHDPTEWRQLMEDYDERIGIMTEGRQITDEDVLAAWESVLDKKNIMEDGNYELPAQHNTRRSAADGQPSIQDRRPAQVQDGRGCGVPRGHGSGDARAA